MSLKLNRNRQRRLHRPAQPQAQARPPRTHLVQLPVAAFSSWTLSGVKSALNEHEDGYFTNSGTLIDWMGRDERISGDLDTRTSALVGKSGVGFTLEAPTNPANAARADEYAKNVERWWFKALPESTQKRLLADGVMAGVSYGPITWESKDDQWIPTVHPWHVSDLYFDESTQQYMAQTLDGIVPVIPGTGEWFLYLPNGVRSWMGGAVRALGLLAIASTFTFADWAHFCERHGKPIMAVKEPPGARDEESAAAAFYESLRELGSSGLLKEPQDSAEQGWEVRLIESAAKSWETFQAFLVRCDTAKSIRLLGQNLSTEVTGGSFAATQAHLRVRQDKLDGDAEGLATAYREQVIIPAGRFNEPAWDDEDATWPVWATGVPEDFAQKSQTMVNVSTALGGFRSNKAPIDQVAFLESFGVPLLPDAKKQMAAPAPPPAVAPVAPPDEGDGDDGDGEGDGDGGEEPPDEGGDDGNGDDGEGNASARMLPTASGLPIAASAGFVEGQSYTDAVIFHSDRHMARDKKAQIAELLKVIDGAKDFEQVYDRVLEHYRDKMSPEAMGALTEKAFILTELGGLLAVAQDAPDAKPEE